MFLITRLFAQNTTGRCLSIRSHAIILTMSLSMPTFKLQQLRSLLMEGVVGNVKVFHSVRVYSKDITKKRQTCRKTRPLK